MKNRFFCAALAILSLAACEQSEPSALWDQPQEMSVSVALDSPETKGYTESNVFYETALSELHATTKNPTPRVIQLSSYLIPQDEASSTYFQGKTFTFSGSNGIWWNSVGGVHDPIYWPLDGKLDFLAFSTSEDDSYGIVMNWDTNNPASQLTLNVPAENSQNDILFASPSGVEPTNSYGSVNMNFKHSQAWLEFVLTGTDNVRLDRIEVNDVYNAGILNIRNNNGNAIASWDFSDESRNDIVVDNIYFVDSLSTVTPKYLDFLIPQQKKTSFTLYYTVGSNTTERSYTFSLDKKTWLMGERYIYSINISATEVTIVPTVTEWNDEPEPAYTVTTSVAAGQGTATVDGLTRKSYSIWNSPALLEATPADGYEFDHWSDGNTDRVRIVSVTESTNYDAYFKVSGTTDHIVEVYTVLSDGITLASSDTVAHDASINLYASTVAGYSFEGWYTSLTGTRLTTGGNYTVDDANLLLTVSNVTSNMTFYAKFARYYHINAQATGPAGSGTVSATYTAIDPIKEGDSYVASATANPGFALEGWYYDSGCTIPVVAGDGISFRSNGTVLEVNPVHQDESFYAKFVPSHTVTVIYEGMGSVSPSSASVVHGNPFTTAATPGLGYSFDGWYYPDTSSTALTNGGNFVLSHGMADSLKVCSVTQDMTILAKFVLSTASSYTIEGKVSSRYSGNASASVAPSGIHTVNPGADDNITATASDGYVFMGWYLDDDCTTPVVADGISIIQADGPVGSMGYPVSSDLNFKHVNRNWTVYAKFMKVYSVTAQVENSPDGSGTVSANGVTPGPTASKFVTSGGSAVFTATANNGYSFVGWYTDEACSTPVSGTDYTVNGNQLTINNVTDDVMVYAKFIESYTVTAHVYNNRGGSITSTNPQNVITGGSVGFDAEAYDNYEIIGWFTDAACEPDSMLPDEEPFEIPETCRIISRDVHVDIEEIASNVDVYVRFEKIHKVTVTKVGNATEYGSVTSDTDEVHYNGSATFTPSAEDGIKFDGWYLDEACTQPATGAADANITLSGDVLTISNISDSVDDYNLYAKFTKKPCVHSGVTTDSPHDSGVVDPNGDTFVDFGNEYTVTATPADGYHFVGWFTDLAGTTQYNGGFTTNPLTVTVNGDMNLYAKFEEDDPEYTVTAQVSTGSPAGSGKVSANSTFGASVSQTVNSGGSAVFTATADTDYAFDGWYKDSGCTPGNKITNGGNYVISGTGGMVLTINNVTADETVYAKFIYSKLTVDVSVDGGASTGGKVYFIDDDTNRSDHITRAFNYQESFEIIAVCEDGWVFDGWRLNGSTQLIKNYSDDESWFNTDANNLVSDYINNGITSNITIVAYFHADSEAWERNVNAVAVPANSGTFTYSTGSSTVHLHGNIQITANANTGYVFRGWYEDSSCTSQINNSDPYLSANGNVLDVNNVTADKTYYAKFEADTPPVPTEYTVTAQVSSDSPSGSGKVSANSTSGASVSQTVNSGGSVVFTAEEITGTLIGWYKDAACNTPVVSGTNGYTVNGNQLTISNVTADETVYAKFILGKAFTVNAEGKKVVFAQGNLLYDENKDEWKIEDRQYYYRHHYDIGTTGMARIGKNASTNPHPHKTPDGTVGSFYWNDDAKKAQLDKADAPGDGKQLFAMNFKTADGSVWDCLTKDEWQYLISKGGYTLATVDYEPGILFFPDCMYDGTKSTITITINGVTTCFDTTISPKYSNYSITEADFNTLQDMGVVFLPAFGYRTNEPPHQVNDHTNGYYWTPDVDTITGMAYIYYLKISETTNSAVLQVLQKEYYNKGMFIRPVFILP